MVETFQTFAVKLLCPAEGIHIFVLAKCLQGACLAAKLLHLCVKPLPKTELLYGKSGLPAVRPGSAMCTGPIFLIKNVIGVYSTNPLFRKRFIHCALMIPFILHWPSLFFSKVSNLRKKVLITPGLYFPNYCVMYLPRDISRDFNKCKHVNLRREELYYTASNQKIADKRRLIIKKD